jgi:hypothetical protein
MSLIKERMEDVRLVLSGAGKALQWASNARWKRLLLVFAVGVAFLLVQHAYLNSLLDEATKASDQAATERDLLTEEHGYRNALDAVQLCMEAEQAKSPHAKWYCSNAVREYEHASQSRLKSGARDIAARLAYGAMRIDLNRYIRSVEVKRLSLAPASNAQQQLDFLLRETVVTLWLLLVAVVLFSAAAGPWILAARAGRGVSDQVGSARASG